MSVIGPGSPYNLIRVKPNQKKIKETEKKNQTKQQNKAKKKNIKITLEGLPILNKRSILASFECQLTSLFIFWKELVYPLCT